MAAILIVEDEAPIRDLIAIYLRRDGHQLTTAADGIEALDHFDRNPDQFDLIVLDLLLPLLDGRGVCRRIRQVSSVPVIMVTALDDSRDKLGGFDLGADDYLTKPFDPNELVARVRAILKRTRADSHQRPGLLRAGNIEIDVEARSVSVGSRNLELRVKEFDLLRLLAENAGIVVSRSTIVERIWIELDDDSRTLDVHVSRLREKLCRSGATASIDTIRTVGLRLSPFKSTC